MSDTTAAPAEIQPLPVPDVPVEAEAAPAPVVAKSVEAPVKAKRVGRKPKAAPAAVTPPPAAAEVAAPAKLAAPRRAAPKSRSVVAKPRRVVNPAVKAPAAKAAAKLKTSSTPLPKAAKTTSSLPKSKDKSMANTPIDFTAAFKTAFADLQEKAKTAYEKSSSALGDANEFAKGNVEALVESGKILASGLQELGTTLTTESRSTFETLTAEAKELAGVKSPTEFFQLQSSLLRKHFDAAVAQTSKNTEAVIKLANEAFSPISNRITLAVEKASKAA